EVSEWLVAVGCSISMCFKTIVLNSSLVHTILENDTWEACHFHSPLLCLYYYLEEIRVLVALLEAGLRFSKCITSLMLLLVQLLCALQQSFNMIAHIFMVNMIVENVIKKDAFEGREVRASKMINCLHTNSYRIIHMNPGIIRVSIASAKTFDVSSNLPFRSLIMWLASLVAAYGIKYCRIFSFPIITFSLMLPVLIRIGILLEARVQFEEKNAALI
ncbi:hypothetical protein ACJX0J_012375, partial [Zea mays]